ncbi:MAG: hypothetical protein BRD43_00625 [Bacteroidetes bacterium QS_4_64_154]|nr:MAG: hypothetical protein BRD43_00625 [Bacteroidetes bacterium QS_4_64_154]
MGRSRRIRDAGVVSGFFLVPGRSESSVGETLGSWLDAPAENCPKMAIDPPSWKRRSRKRRSWKRRSRKRRSWKRRSWKRRSWKRRSWKEISSEGAFPEEGLPE